MPIKSENKHLYPRNWKEIRTRILVRADNKCEWCGTWNHSWLDGPRRKLVLTVAHLDHDPTHNADENLAALCQKCHNGYDAKHRAANARRTREQKRRQYD